MARTGANKRDFIVIVIRWLDMFCAAHTAPPAGQSQGNEAGESRIARRISAMARTRYSPAPRRARSPSTSLLSALANVRSPTRVAMLPSARTVIATTAATAIASTPKLSASYALHLLDLAARLGVREEEILAGFDLTREDLADPNRSLPIDVAIALHERGRILTGEPALGIYLGLQMQASAHGIVGFAAMSAGTVRDAILVAVRYMAIRTTALALHTQVHDDTATLILVEHADLGSVREIYVLSILVGFWQMGCKLAGRNLDLSFDLQFPRPDYYKRFEHILPPTRFDQPVNQIVLRDLALLASPISMADAASARLARTQCEELLASMGLDGRIAPRVRALLGRKDGASLSVNDVARALRVSPRTFRRRLEAERVTFSSLLDTERKRRALLLLRSQELSIEEIGDRLGYHNVANFTRAFRRWTGKTPRAYRNGA
jgi:AraC-like DNA-binding protein